MKHKIFTTFRKGLVLSFLSLGLAFSTLATNNVFDSVIAKSPNHTSLTAAINTAGLANALRDMDSTYTVFAPDNDAFDKLAADLNTNITGLLNLSNLSDILLYHVLGDSVNAAAVTNGAVVQPLSSTNTVKLTKTSMGAVYANHSQVNAADLRADNGIVHSLSEVILPNKTVVDVALENGFTTLATAVITAELLPALTDPFDTVTVFAPSNAAFTTLISNLGTDVNGLLASANLADILTYHVLRGKVESSAITNGLIAQPISTTNTLKLTKTSSKVFLNHAEITATDVPADNGVVHVLGDVVLPNKTVVDVAIDNGFTTLTTAVVTAELVPTLTNPFDTFTVFAPNNAAFSKLINNLGTDVDGLLASPNLADILTYHVLSGKVEASAITNGQVVQPVSTSNTLKLTKTSSQVFLNHAEITATDVPADNGVVHVLGDVVLPNKTVVDVAIDNSFTTLVSAVIAAELVPTLSNPFDTFTVFAPTNDAFDTFASQNNLTLQQILELSTLGDVLTYHVVAGKVLSTDLSNGPVATVEGSNVIVDINGGVKINASNVTLPDVDADNGVVHVIDAVLSKEFLSTDKVEIQTIKTFPNPTADVLNIDGNLNGQFTIIDMSGKTVSTGELNNQNVDVSSLVSGTYIINIVGEEGIYTSRFYKK